jgi:hypothetical protein
VSDFAGRDGWELRFQAISNGLLNRQLDELMRMLGDPPRLGNVPSSFWTQARAEMVEMLGPLLQDLYNDAASQALRDTLIPVDWAMVNERAATWADQYAFSLVTRLNEHSLGTLRETIPQSFRKDWTMDVLRSELTGTFGPVRASMIATTEVTRAAAEGQAGLVREIRRENPDVRMIGIWQTNNDAIVRACPICWPMHHRMLNQHGWYVHPNSGMAFRRPPAHVRCRCWENYELVK